MRTTIAYAAALSFGLLLSACTLITDKRIEPVIDCTDKPDGTVCGNQFSDGLARVCRAELCVLDEAPPCDGGTCTPVVDCTKEPDGTLCGTQPGDDQPRVCRAGLCVLDEEPPCDADAGECTPVSIDTVITSQPSDPSGPSVVFQFSSTRVGAGFQCSLDDAPFDGCTSPQSYEALTAGQHSFRVRGVEGDDVDPTPASFTWVVDPLQADTAITSGPEALTGRNVTFTFDGNLAESFECMLEPSETSFTACTSPMVYSALPAVASPGYRFVVRGLTGEGVPDSTPASQRFMVDATGPTAKITGTPAAGSSGQMTDAAMSFSVFPPEDFVTYVCRFDSAATFTSCTTFVRLGLDEGSHTLRVKAIDLFGNEGPEAAYSWTINAGTETTIAAIRANPVEGKRVHIKGSGSTCVRISRFGEEQVFAQETEAGLDNTGISIFANNFDFEAAQAVPGACLDVTGTIRQYNNNLTLENAVLTYTGYSQLLDARRAGYDALVNQEVAEGVLLSVNVARDTTSASCPTWTTPFETCDGEIVCANFTGTATQLPDYGYYTGVLEQQGSAYVFHVFESEDQGDACL